MIGGIGHENYEIIITDISHDNVVGFRGECVRSEDGQPIYDTEGIVKKIKQEWRKDCLQSRCLHKTEGGEAGENMGKSNL